jgi:hypothetical protein
MSRALAICALSVGLERLNVENLKGLLVKRFMAFLVEFDMPTAQAVISYPQEPLLSLLAAEVIRKNPTALLRYVLGSHKVSSMSVGNLAEFVARVILLLTRICSSGLKLSLEHTIFDFARPIRLQTFLEGLMGTEQVVQLGSFIGDGLGMVGGNRCAALEAFRMLSTGLVIFSHFGTPEKLSADPMTNITYALRHNSAIHMGGQHQGSDIAIPVILRAEGEQSWERGLLLFEVKSHATQISPGSVDKIKTYFSQMNSPDFLDLTLPTICIVMQLSRQKNALFTKTFTRSRCGVEENPKNPLPKKRMFWGYT